MLRKLDKITLETNCQGQGKEICVEKIRRETLDIASQEVLPYFQDNTSKGQHVLRN